MTETHVNFYYKTSDAWQAMYDDCLLAEKSIEFEQYILLDDGAGHRFLELFAEKARAGVKIRLLLDPIGSLGVESSESFKKIIAAGGDIKFYNRLGIVNLFFPGTWYPRNHTKTLLIDGKVGFVGSVCLSEEMRDWNDFHMRFEGALCREVEEAFKISQVGSQTSYEDIDAQFRYKFSQPHRHHNPLYEELLIEIFKAQKEICLVSPYFLPPRRLRKALFAAIKRGVKVKIMISEKTDVRIADFVSRTYFRSLLRHGARIFLYSGQMLHSKYAAIDQSWATIGSSNMDYLSLLHNREANVLVREPETVTAVQNHFKDDLKSCQEVTLEYCRKIPLHQRVAGWMGRPLKRIL